jgi:hypothetical protein
MQTFTLLAGLTRISVPGTIVSAELMTYDAVVFLHTGEEALDQNQRDVLQEYVRRGKGFVGIGASCRRVVSGQLSTFDELLGATCPTNATSAFLQSPQAATVLVNDRFARRWSLHYPHSYSMRPFCFRSHPSTKHFPLKWNATDLWLDFSPSPRLKNHVLLSVSEKTFRGGRMGADHPISWCKMASRGSFAPRVSISLPPSHHFAVHLQVDRGLLVSETPLAPGGRKMTCSWRMFSRELLGLLAHCLVTVTRPSIRSGRSKWSTRA